MLLIEKNEITRRIYSNSEWSEQFLVTECHFNLFLEVSNILQISTIRTQIKKIMGFRNIREKLENEFCDIMSHKTARSFAKRADSKIMSQLFAFTF